MPITASSGGPGWRTRRNRVFRVLGLLAAALVFASAAVNFSVNPRGSGAAAGFGLLLLALAAPMPRSKNVPHQVVHDGSVRTAIPMRALPWRIVIGLSAVGALILVGAVGGAWRTMSADGAKAALMLLLGGGMGVLIGGFGVLNLLPSARRPRPILLSDEGVSWVFGGRRQYAPWNEIAAIEPWWTPIGRGVVQPTTNHILLRGHDGEPITTFRIQLLEVDPTLALRTMRESMAAAATTRRSGHA